MAAGPRAEHSMIRNPCSGGVVAIAPPVREGRIVAVAAPGAGARVWPYWGRWSRSPLDDALDGLRGHGDPATGRSAWPTTGPWRPRPWPTWAARTPSPRWVEHYRRRLEPAPPPADRPLSEEDWPQALGRGRALRGLARVVRARGRRPPARRRRRRVGPAPPAGRGRRGHARAHPHRARRPRPGGGGHAPAPARVGERPGVLGLDLPGATRPTAADRQGGRARRARRPAVSGRGRAAPAAHQRHGGAGGRHRRRVRAGGRLARLERRPRRVARRSWPRAARWPICATRTTAAPSVSSTR